MNDRRTDSRVGRAGLRLLAAAVLQVLCLSLVPGLAAAGGSGHPEIMSAADAWRGLTHGTLTLIDVRTPREWRGTGVPPGAELISIGAPGGRTGFLERVRALGMRQDLDRVALICAGGVRSTRAATWLHRAGFRHVYNVREGMRGRTRVLEPAQPGWLSRGLPVAPWAAPAR